MDNTNLDTWYKHRCHAPGLKAVENSASPDVSQDTLLQDEEPDLDGAYNELEAIKTNLKLLRSKLLISPDTWAEALVVPPESATPPTTNLQQLLQLRNSNNVLKSQVQKITQHLQDKHSQLRTLEAMRCIMNQRLSEMTDKLEKFREFQFTAKHNHGICLERYEQIKMCKLDPEDFGTQMITLMFHTQARMRYLVPMRCHNQLHYELSVELVLIRIYLHSLFSHMMNDWNQCKQRLIQYNWHCASMHPQLDNLKFRD